jgi:hypothetical protein
MTRLDFGGLKVLHKKNMVMGLFHFSKRRLVNEKKPFSKAYDTRRMNKFIRQGFWLRERKGLLTPK